MISEHELLISVRAMLPEIQTIESQCLDLFNRHTLSPRGRTGVQGSSEVIHAVGYLRSAANMLERMAMEKGILRAWPEET